MDTMVGGPGDDTFKSVTGNDLYLFARGDGRDLIYESGGNPGNHSILYFREGITPADIRIQSVDASGSILLTVLGGDDQLTIRRMVATEKRYEFYAPIQEIDFSDGTRWSYHQIVDRIFDGSDFDDLIEGSYNSDLLNGRAGSDRLTGGLGNDTLIGGVGSDILIGGAGSDTFYADGGDDTLSGGEGADLYIVASGCGRDWIQDLWLYNDATGRISFVDGITASDLSFKRSGDDLCIDVALFGSALTLKDVFASVNLRLTVEPLRLEFSDATVWSYQQICLFLLRGNEQDQVLLGYGGADRIDGAGGDDSIWGAAGRDMLWGRAGNDTLSGGDGLDTLDGGEGSDHFDGGTGDDLMLGGDGDDVFKTAFFNSGKDTIYGGAGDDLFVGASGAESFFGEAGDDTAIGGAGGDSLIGGFGSDFLDGGVGADWLQPGSGIDTLSGGAGADRFVFLNLDDAGLGLLNHDLITDFQVGDAIDLAAIDANDVLLGDQGFRFIGASRFSALGQLRYTCSGGNGLLEANCAGGLDADFQLTLLGAVPLQPTSFVL
jgi:Ca2+-binding RTX toxin-like protein